MTETRDRANEAGREGVVLPAPTSSPLYLALGLALLFGGIVTHPLVSAVGFVTALSGAIGWWREVLPREQELLSPLQSASERARAIVARPSAVEHLVPGRDQHRQHLPVKVRPYSSGLWGGVVGSAAMAAVACAYGIISQDSPWLPINLLAGMLLPSLAAASIEQLRAFHGVAFALASFMHLGLSLLVGLFYAVVLPMLPGRPLIWGSIIAPLTWTALAWSTLGLVNPALNQHVSWPWFIVSQIAFGLAAGSAISRIEPVETLQSLSLAARAGIESPGVSQERGEEP